MEIKSKVELHESFVRKWAPIAMIAGVAYFGSWFFLRMMAMGSDNPEMRDSFFGENGPGGIVLPLAVAMGGAAGFIIMNDKKREIKYLLFDEEAKTLTLRYKPYWGEKLREKKIAYQNLNYRIKEEEHLGGKSKEYIIFHDGLRTVARFTPEHPFWAKHQLAEKKIVAKLDGIRGKRG